MNSAIERLLSLRVSDVMTSKVVELSAHQTMAEAAATLSKHGISGAPVVDELGHCVGLLSATDFVSQQGGAGGERLSCAEHKMVDGGKDEPLHIETVTEDLVQDHMSRAIQSIGPGDTILRAARVMCAEHIHRLPVLDDRGHTLGLISSLDITAALVHAIEE